MHFLNPSIQEDEAERWLQVQGQPGVHSKIVPLKKGREHQKQGMMVVHTSDPSTLEAEAGRSQVQRHPRLHSKTPKLKKKKLKLFVKKTFLMNSFTCIFKSLQITHYKDQKRRVSSCFRNPTEYSVRHLKKVTGGRDRDSKWLVSNPGLDMLEVNSEISNDWPFLYFSSLGLQEQTS